ncbi:MAG: photosynthetic complex putative assembly protein PuhB [Pseudomonadota bacterium]
MSSLFHDEEVVDAEPMRGLPEVLPEDETLLWQGRPSAVGLMFGAFRVRWIIAYFVLTTFGRLSYMASVDAAPQAMNSVALTSVLTCILAVTILGVIAFAMSRAAIFTITSKRVVIRHGVALPKFVNAPFSRMQSAQLRRRSPRLGDIALQMEEAGRTPYLHLWPFAKPFKYTEPQPMLRSLREPETIAKLLAEAVQNHAPGHVVLSPATTDADEPKEQAVPSGAAPAL